MDAKKTGCNHKLNTLKDKYPDWNWEYWEAQVEGFDGD